MPWVSQVSQKLPRKTVSASPQDMQIEATTLKRGTKMRKAHFVVYCQTVKRARVLEVVVLGH